jgi:glycosyltransferase involved in cell wall biosynthesis
MRVGLSTLMIQRGQTGVAQYVFALMQALLRRPEAHEYILFVLEEDLPLFEFARSSVRLVPVSEKFRSPIPNIFWHQTALPRYVRQLGLEVLHVPSYRRLLWPRPCALVGTIHDLAPFLVARKYDAKRMFYGRVVVKRLARRQDRIIAISHNTARDISKFFQLRGERLTVVYNGLDHQRFFPDSRATAKRLIAERHGVSGDFFLYTARLEHPGKNHVRLLQSFDAFKSATGSSWKLVFAGSDWQGADAIHETIRSSPFASDIRALSFVPPADLPALYRAADVFVYPSLYEGFGLPPLEAMASGCPVISSARGALEEIVGDAAEIIDPDDTADMARKLGELAGESIRREQLRAAGLAHAKKFNWDRTADATLEVYEQARRQFEDGRRLGGALTSGLRAQA